MKNDNTKEGRKVLAQAKAEHRHAYFIQNCFECPLLYIGMKNVILDLLHVGDLNINKQVRNIVHHTKSFHIMLLGLCCAVLRERKKSTSIPGVAAHRCTNRRSAGIWTSTLRPR
uniref:Uncharacterized protein n=1 Tax=Chrysotila carterae TaxID=13221 RepID=A0A7S4F4G1_CHRCT|mmetsp:Transcript_30620/g.64448  ORF Transcript_30620/g.64448 Transcript_30620/m.64448 type:complete len:114 (-) Transcript_30620:763-1104(-)